jgi:hypothetical protein
VLLHLPVHINNLGFLLGHLDFGVVLVLFPVAFEVGDFEFQGLDFSVFTRDGEFVLAH